MKRWILIFTTLPVVLLAVASSGSFTTGDYLFVKAQIIGCGSQIRFVEVGQVTDSGQVTLFEDIVLETEGKTTPEIVSQLIDSLEQRTGHRSKTIKITRVSAEDPKTATNLMMLIHSERSHKCELELPPAEFPDWLGEFQIAHMSSHNKSFNRTRESSAARFRGNVGTRAG